MAYQPKQYNETLQNICNFAITANHLINFQLVRSIPNENIQNQSSAKPEYFGFLTLAPGEGNNENRTYNFQNKVTVKFSLQEYAGLSFVLKKWADGAGKAVFPYTKFAKSGQGSKSVSVWEPQQTAQQNGQPKPRMVSITVKENSNGSTISLTPDQAYATSESLAELFKKGINLEFERQINAPKVTQPRGNGNSYNNFNQNSTPFQSAPPSFQPQGQVDNSNPFGPSNDFQSIGNDFENMLMG
jgi:hypothetical protein